MSSTWPGTTSLARRLVTTPVLTFPGMLPGWEAAGPFLEDGTAGRDGATGPSSSSVT